MKFRLSIASSLQTLASLAALGGSAFCLVWQQQRQASEPLPHDAIWSETAPLVVVDAGHGGHDGGAVSHGVTEKKLSLDIAKRLKQELEKAGVRVVMTRQDDSYLTLDERAAFTSRYNADAFVSVHLNTDGEGSDAEGIETYYAANTSLSARQLVSAETRAKKESSSASAEFAGVVQRLVCSTTKAGNRGTKARDYAVVARAACPAVLVECGFITSASESVLIKQAEYRDRLADGIARGVVLFLQSQPAKAPVIAAVAGASVSAAVRP